MSESKGKGVRWKKYTYTYVYIYKVCSHGGQSGFLKMNMGSCYFFLLSETLSGFPSTQDPSSESFPCLYTLHGLSTQLPFSCSLISRNILSTTMLQAFPLIILCVVASHQIITPSFQSGSKYQRRFLQQPC